MSKLLWWGIGGVAFVGAAFGIGYMAKLNRFSKKLDTLLKADLFSASISEIVIRIFPTLKNPTDTSVKVRHPYVRLIYGGETLASSELVNKVYQIPKYDKKDFDPIYFSLPLVKLAMTAPAALKEYRSNGQVKLKVETITEIDGKIPYSTIQDVTIGSGAKQE